jgi:CHRD domain
MQLAGAVALVALLGVVGAAIATNGDSEFRERLTGYEEVPALSTPGNGEFKAVIDRGDDEIRYRLSFRETETPVTQAHIHFEQRTNNGGIVLFLCSNLGNGPAGTPACPPGGGTVRGTLGPEDVFGGASAQGIALGEFDEVIDAMRAGATYANVHTTGRPGGEIRAQLDDDDDHDHGGHDRH